MKYLYLLKHSFLGECSMQLKPNKTYMWKSFIVFFVALVMMCGCSDFLDLKPDKQMDIPGTLADCDLLLNDFSVLNMGFASANLIAGEEIFLHSDDWKAIIDPDEKNAYIWSDEPTITDVAWQGSYRVIFVANQVLSIVESLPQSDKNSDKAEQIIGEAHFFRAFAYQQLAEMYCLGYNSLTAETEFGLPLKFNPDLDLPNGRATLGETYRQVISDYKLACNLLGTTAVAKSRPTKIAAYAGLARLYLDMQDFESSFLYADSAWRSQPQLLDYNLLDVNDMMSIPMNNEEIVFKAFTYYAEMLDPYVARIDPELIALYESGDLRKEIFFQHNSFDPGTYGYKTNYDQSYVGSFVGLTTSEILLIRAEAASRLGRYDQARHDVDLLRAYRFVPATYHPVQWSDEMLLDELLKERRRELVFRGRRWADIKRLNKESGTKVEPRREIDGYIYELKSNSKKYAFLLPQTVLDLNPTISQNKR